MIRLDSVNKEYKKGGFFSKSTFRALNNISLHIEDGEHVGIIGESGAGKTTLGKILSLIEPPSSGSVFFSSEKITKNNIKQKRKEIGVVFQDPYTSFDPKQTMLHSLLETEQSKENIFKQCKQLNIKESLLYKYPNTLSGGELQRISIARAILSNPKYLLFDEATSALDVSTQAKIVNMLCDINNKKQYTYIFITHDLKLAAFISDRVYVLYDGYIVEETDDINNPLHPYTKMLTETTNFKKSKQSKKNINNGCFFYDTCPYKKDICKNSMPKLNKTDNKKSIRCFLYD